MIRRKELILCKTYELTFTTCDASDLPPKFLFHYYCYTLEVSGGGGRDILADNLTFREIKGLRVLSSRRELYVRYTLFI